MGNTEIGNSGDNLQQAETRGSKEGLESNNQTVRRQARSSNLEQPNSEQLAYPTRCQFKHKYH
jgi:hypothetical protein